MHGRECFKKDLCTFHRKYEAFTASPEPPSLEMSVAVICPEFRRGLWDNNPISGLKMRSHRVLKYFNSGIVQFRTNYATME